MMQHKHWWNTERHNWKLRLWNHVNYGKNMQGCNILDAIESERKGVLDKCTPNTYIVINCMLKYVPPLQ